MKPIIYLLAFLSPLSLWAQDAKNRIDKLIDYIEVHNQSIGVISVYKDSAEVYQRQFGSTAVPNSLVNKSNLYRIGSVTKAYTSTLILGCVENGKLMLTTRLSTYFPQVPGAEKITIENILEHSAGLGDYVVDKKNYYWEAKPAPQKVILERIFKEPLAFEPGTAVKYSNSGYYLLARILEKIYKKEYHEILKQEICIPYELHQTYSAKDIKGHVINPSLEFNGKWQTKLDFSPKNNIGVGDIVASPQDVNRFFRLLMSNRILKPETVALMTKGSKFDNYFGMGTLNFPIHNRSIPELGGDTWGTHTRAYFDPQYNIYYCIIVNGERFPTSSLKNYVIKDLLNIPYELPIFRTGIVIGPSVDRLVGTYYNEVKDFKIIFSKDGDYLRATQPNRLTYLLDYKDKLIFEVPNEEAHIEFVPDEDKMILHQNNEQVVFRKILRR